MKLTLNQLFTILRMVVLIIIILGNTNQAIAKDEPAEQNKRIKVTALNYVKAKTAIQFDKYLALADGEINTLNHRRNLVGVNAKSSKRLNRDTLYSVAIVDISKGATLYIPDPGPRYISAQIVNEDGFTNRVFYGSGTFSLTIEEFHTPFVWVLIRTLVSEAIPGDIEAANKLQNQMKITSISNNPYVHASYDPVSFKATTKLLLELGAGLDSNAGAAGKKEEVNPVMQLLATAYGFGTLPERDSLLINVQPELPASGTYTLKIDSVPVDGFWSLTVYDKDGYFNENQYGKYSVSDRTAVENMDGSVTINFGGDENSKNFLPISDGWNYVVRLYRPRQAILDGEWNFPTIDVSK